MVLLTACVLVDAAGEFVWKYNKERIINLGYRHPNSNLSLYYLPQFIIICDHFLFLELLLTKDPVFAKDELVFLSREESYSRSLQKGAHFLQLLKEQNITSDEDILMLKQ